MYSNVYDDVTDFEVCGFTKPERITNYISGAEALHPVSLWHQ